MAKRCFILIFSLLYNTFFPSANAQSSLGSRILKNVQVLRSGDAEFWRPLPATARIADYTDSLSIIIWNNWGEEKLNPIFQLHLYGPPSRDSSGNWQYTGIIYNTTNEIRKRGKPCIIVSSTKIAITINSEFTVIENDRTIRYRMSPKAPRKP